MIGIAMGHSEPIIRTRRKRDADSEPNEVLSRTPDQQSCTHSHHVEEDVADFRVATG